MVAAPLLRGRRRALRVARFARPTKRGMPYRSRRALGHSRLRQAAATWYVFPRGPRKPHPEVVGPSRQPARELRSGAARRPSSPAPRWSRLPPASLLRQAHGNPRPRRPAVRRQGSRFRGQAVPEGPPAPVVAPARCQAVRGGRLRTSMARPRVPAAPHWPGPPPASLVRRAHRNSRAPRGTVRAAGFPAEISSTCPFPRTAALIPNRSRSWADRLAASPMRGSRSSDRRSSPGWKRSPRTALRQTFHLAEEDRPRPSGWLAVVADSARG